VSPDTLSGNVSRIQKRQRKSRAKFLLYIHKHIYHSHFQWLAARHSTKGSKECFGQGGGSATNLAETP
jgi:fido (protein-threonine AMPylation protein)